MKKGMVLFLSSILIIFSISFSLYAEDQKDTVVSIAKAAKELIAKEGRVKAFTAFNDMKGAFVKGDIYIWSITFDAVCLQHPTNQKLVGMKVPTLKDANGKAFISEIIDAAKKADDGWIEYSWNHHETKKITPKKAYFMKVKDTEGEFLIVSSYYLQ
ncbi:MAG: cache domain-containing protein [Oligoflexia bacterium]|nr:cache domain-containing protein [Oligoflexia bacterium]